MTGTRLPVALFCAVLGLALRTESKGEHMIAADLHRIANMLYSGNAMDRRDA